MILLICCFLQYLFVYLFILSLQPYTKMYMQENRIYSKTNKFQ